MEKEILVQALSELGFPVLTAIVLLYALFLVLKLILSDVVVMIKKILDLIQTIKSELRLIEHDVAVLDILVTSALGVKIDLSKFVNKINQKDES